MITTQTPARKQLETSLVSKENNILVNNYFIKYNNNLARFNVSAVTICSHSGVIKLTPTRLVHLELLDPSIRRYLQWAMFHGGVHLNVVRNRKWRNVVRVNMNADSNPDIVSYFRTPHTQQNLFKTEVPKFDIEWGMDFLRFKIDQMVNCFDTPFKSLQIVQHMVAEDKYDNIGTPYIFAKTNIYSPSAAYLPYLHGYVRIDLGESEDKFWAICNTSTVRIVVSKMMPEILTSFCQIGNCFVLIVDQETRSTLMQHFPFAIHTRRLRQKDYGPVYQFEDEEMWRSLNVTDENTQSALGDTVFSRSLSNREMHALNGNIRIICFVALIAVVYIWYRARKTLNRLAHAINGNTVIVRVGEVVIETTVYNADINSVWELDKQPPYPFLTVSKNDKTTYFGFCTSLPEETFNDLVGIKNCSRPRLFLDFINANLSHCEVQIGKTTFRGICAFKNEAIFIKESNLTTRTVKITRPKTSSNPASSEVPQVIVSTHDEKEHQSAKPTKPSINDLKLDEEGLCAIFPDIPREKIQESMKTNTPLEALRVFSASYSASKENKQVVPEPSKPVSPVAPIPPVEPVPDRSIGMHNAVRASDVHYLAKSYTSYINKDKIGHRTSPLMKINEYLETASPTDFKKTTSQVDTLENVVCTNAEWFNTLLQLVKDTVGIGTAVTLVNKFGSKLPNSAQHWVALSSFLASAAYVGYKTFIQAPVEILKIHKFSDPVPINGSFNTLPSHIGCDVIKSPCLKTTCHTFTFKYDYTPCDTITRRDIIFSPMLLEEIKRSFNPHITIDNTSSRAGWFVVMSSLVRAWSNKMVFDAPVEAVFSGTVHVAVCQIADDLNMQQDFC